MSAEQQPRDEFEEEERMQRQQALHVDEEGGMHQEITMRDIVVYTLRNYIFSLIGDMSSKLFPPKWLLSIVRANNPQTKVSSIETRLDFYHIWWLLFLT